MVKIYPHVAGNTLDSHEKFIQSLKNRHAKVLPTQEGSDVTIVFCPIVSRFETDIQAALSGISGSSEVILVAMHHTYDPNYTLPDKRPFDHTAVKLLVECLFFEKKGLLKCPQNKKAKKDVYKWLGLSKIPKPNFKKDANKKKAKKTTSCFSQ